ncbi:hypothetical protein ACFY2M_07410 [Streptomyces sp. NPDC001276]|uniref:hypothetical protein n=1 Tax=Streptomyces sp. NPDC001276 TaxID=3364555 RepID=UPI0036ADC8E1
MTTQPEQGHELVPRPERTPEAVRVVLARVAPHRLGEMEQHKEQALATAIQDGKIGTVSPPDRPRPPPRRPAAAQASPASEAESPHSAEPCTPTRRSESSP